MNELEAGNNASRAIPEYSDWQWSFQARLVWLVLGILGGAICVIFLRNFSGYQTGEKIFSAVLSILVLVFCCVPVYPVTFGRLSTNREKVRWNRFYAIKTLCWENVSAIKGIRRVTVFGHRYYMLRCVLNDGSVEGIFSTSEEAYTVFREIRRVFSEQDASERTKGV
ncbi:MAG: hypothetical protein GF350_11960 [Chitinivibrionales bacterium]|nr:hypothetical protein [Chitinivibrionales bacterium]